MNLRALRLFVELMDRGTLTRAAEAMHLSQSAASRLVALLEAELGTPLFLRERRRMVATAAAAALHPEALRILAQVDALPDTLRAEAAAPLRVLCQTRLVPGLAVPAIAAVAAGGAARGAPPVHLEAAPRRELARRAATGRHDLLLATLPLPVEGVEAELLGTAPLGVLLPRGHPLAARPALSARDLAGVPYVALDRTTVIRRVVDMGATPLPPPLVEVSAGSAAYRLVADGLGFTFADRIAVEPELWDRVVLRPWAERIDVTIGAARIGDRPRAADDLMAALRRVAEGPGPRGPRGRAGAG